MTLPIVAVIGRPNVGKSTLVNRILGRRAAIVQERPGVTRDRVFHEAEWFGRQFVVADTGGLESDPQGELAGKVAETAKQAAEQADVILFVIDSVAGATSEDRDVAERVRRSGKPVYLVANKADTAAREQLAHDFYDLGLGNPYPVSALHGRGLSDLLDVVCADFPTETEDMPEHPGIAIVGRPNVGKSSLFNRFAGGDRSIVHDMPGTTRDSVDTVVTVGERTYRFVDTAGMRRFVKVDDSTEYYGNVRTLKALDRSEIALIVMDASEGLTRQDLRIGEQVAELGRSAILVLNKIDQLSPALRKQEREEIRRRMPYLSWAPLVEVSAATGEGVTKILPALARVLDARPLRVPTPQLNVVIDDLQARRPVPSKTGKARVKFAVQAETSPPLIALFGSGKIPEQWLRYLERGIREKFGFEGTPIHFSMRGSTPRRGSVRQSDGRGRK